MTDIVVIGGGVAGLSAGIYSFLNAQRAGVTPPRVALCEKGRVAGGNLTGWSRGGYSIDTCIHWLTGTNPSTRMYRRWCDLGALGDGVAVERPETLFTVAGGGARVSLHRDIGGTVAEMLAASPADAREIRAYGRAVEAWMRLQGIAGPGRDEGVSGWGKAAAVRALLPYVSRTTGRMAAQFRSPLLREYVRALMGSDFGALALIATSATFCGGNGDMPEGGSVPMARRMADRFVSLGGVLRTRMEARSITVVDGRARSVTFASGETLPADYVIVAIDPAMVFGHILDAPMPRDLRREYARDEFKRFSCVCCAFGYEGGSVPFENDLAVEVPREHRRLMGTDLMLVREFSHREGAAPQGRVLLQTMALCDEEMCRDYIALAHTDKAAYRARKAAVTEATRDSIERTMPRMRGRLTPLDCWTPATFRRFTGAQAGSFMAFTMPPNYIPRHVSNRVDGVDNVILASQWLLTPGGLPTAAVSGQKAAATVADLINSH